MDAQVAEFMSRVVPWPAEGEPGWINLHWRIPNPHDKAKPDLWTGKPTRSLKEFMSLLNWVMTRANTRDVYFCLSLQGKTATNSKGSVIASRFAEDALLIKSLWLDLDVKGPSDGHDTKKGYASIEDALKALADFRAQSGMPKPNAYIASGGGVHVYWIMEQSLTREQWQPIANGLKTAAINFGLKCDIGCTIDAARVLRVPGTFNYKTDPRRDVKVLSLSDA